MHPLTTRRTVALALLCLWLPLAAVAAYALAAADRLARAAQADAATQNWEAAFRGYQAALSFTPWSPSLRRALAETALRWAWAYDGSAEPAAERALIAELATSGEEAALARVLQAAMVTVTAGPFWMGDAQGRDDEQPVRRITLEMYQLDRYEVTNAEYGAFVEATDATPPRYWSDGEYPQGTAAQPVVGVSWQQAQAFCRWAGKRLPTEAEWEKACRGEGALAYPWGAEWDPKRANVGVQSAHAWPTRLDEVWDWLAVGGEPSAPALVPVGSHPEGSSPYGVMDLVGNASEWVQDAYNWSGYTELPSEDPLTPNRRGTMWCAAAPGSIWPVSRRWSRSSAAARHVARPTRPMIRASVFAVPGTSRAGLPQSELARRATRCAAGVGIVPQR